MNEEISSVGFPKNISLYGIDWRKNRIHVIPAGPWASEEKWLIYNTGLSGRYLWVPLTETSQGTLAAEFGRAQVRRERQ